MPIIALLSGILTAWSPTNLVQAGRIQGRCVDVPLRLVPLEQAGLAAGLVLLVDVVEVRHRSSQDGRLFPLGQHAILSLSFVTLSPRRRHCPTVRTTVDYFLWGGGAEGDKIQDYQPKHSGADFQRRHCQPVGSHGSVATPNGRVDVLCLPCVRRPPSNRKGEVFPNSIGSSSSYVATGRTTGRRPPAPRPQRTRCRSLAVLSSSGFSKVETPVSLVWCVKRQTCTGGRGTGSSWG